MEATFNKSGSKLSIGIKGRLDTVTSRDFMSELTWKLTEDTVDVDIDCSGLEYISSSGLRAFMVIYKNITPKGGKLVLKSVTPQVGEVLNITGMATLFNIE